MKKGTLFSLSLLFGICLLLFACKRDIDNYLHDRKEAPSMLLESAKIWHMQHLEMDGALKLKPYWKDAWTVKSTSGKTLILVPAPEKHIDNKDISIRRFFVFEGNGMSINNGLIVELLGVKYDVNDQFDYLLKNYDKGTITGFNGDILQYDVNYHFLRSATYENGKKTNKEALISYAESLSKDNGGIGATNKLKTSSTCTDFEPTYIGFPGLVAPPGCRWWYRQEIERDVTTGCMLTNVRIYTHTQCDGICTSCGNGSSSAGNGSGSGSGSGSGAGSSPDYGGGGSAPKIKYSVKLTTDFPCIVPTILTSLLGIPQYKYWVQPFNTGQAPDLTWDYNTTQTWNVPSNASTVGFNAELGQTSTDRTPTNVDRGANIYFNKTFLQNSSKLFIASVAIHETLHAYVNYSMKTISAGFVQPQTYNQNKNWGFALAAHGYTFGLPSNTTDHAMMLQLYFTTAVNILSIYDNGSHTNKQYAMLIMYGLNTGDSAPLQSMLNQLYTNVKTAYNITDNELATYWLSQLNAPANEKLSNNCP